MEADLKALVLEWVRGWVKGWGRTFRRKLGPCTVNGSREGEGLQCPLTRHPKEAVLTEESPGWLGQALEVQSQERPCLPQDELLACRVLARQSEATRGRVGAALSS